MLLFEAQKSSALQQLRSGDKAALHENANKDATVFNTQRDLTAGAVAKDVALNEMLPSHIAQAHLTGDIHFHDLDYSPYTPMTNCCLCLLYTSPSPRDRG